MRLSRHFGLLLASGCAALMLPAIGLAAPNNAEAAQATAPFVQSECQQVVMKLAETLERDFVMPEVGKAYAAMLRTKLAEGGYQQFADSAAFAASVTADLQRVHMDGHLRLMAPKTSENGQRKMATTFPAASTILAKGWLAPGVAYVSFSAFYGNDETMKELASFLAKIAGAKALVIDQRQHRGGGMEEMNLILAQLFEKRTALLDMDTREAVYARLGGGPEEDASLERIAAPATVVRERHWATPSSKAGLTRTKVYVLTSSYTASAAEHLTLALKRTRRATIIGETTKGAGNFGMPALLGFGYSAFIPVGRTFDPDSNLGWEGTGVAPTIAVPADRALGKALELAGIKADATKALAALQTP